MNNKLLNVKKEMPLLNGNIPIVLAYGVRWDRKHWENVQKRKLPQFIDFPTPGIYFYYWKGQPVYVGMTKVKLHRRIAGWHKEIANKWDSFSWFVINPQLYIKDIENLILRALTYLGPGQAKMCNTSALPFIPKNTGASGFLTESDTWRNYWLDADGRLTVARESARSILTPEWQQRCLLKRQKN